MTPLRDQLTRATFSVREISEQAASIEDIVRLDIGQPDFSTPPEAVRAAQEAIKDGEVPYTALWGIEELREAVAGFESHKAGPSPDEVMVTTGGTGALFTAFEAITEPGEGILCNDPCWPPYGMVSAAATVRKDQVAFFDDDGVAVDRVEAAVQDDTRALVINSPENPTGRVYSREDIEDLAGIAERQDLWLIADEVYDRLTYGCDHVSVAEVAPERTLTVNSTSKNFAMTGWRLGWLIAPEEIRQQAGKANRGSTACPSFPAQHAALGALEGAQDYPTTMRADYAERVAVATDLLRDAGIEFVEPEGAIYLFPDVGQDSWELCRRLNSEGGVSLVPGTPSGEDSSTNVRLCFGSASEDELREGIRRLVDAL